ncbi:MAG: peptide chain release factor N(5)-glutamine methyltransferase [Hyphomicrobiaceae bacterium]
MTHRRPEDDLRDDGRRGVAPDVFADWATGQAVALADAVKRVAAILHASGVDTPGLDARRLTLGLLLLDEVVLVREPERPVGHDEIETLKAGVLRRLAHEPVSRILGRRSFHGMEFEIGAATLDPRPDTETLVDGVIGLVRSGVVPGGVRPRILDLGTGAGAILIALLAALPGATGVGCDIDADALAIAKANARRLGVDERAGFITSKWFETVDGVFDLIVSNPPYIPRDEIAGLDAEVRLYDPHLALDGGVSGLVEYETIIAGLPGALAADGWVVFEVGRGQASDVADLLVRAGGNVTYEIQEPWLDLAGVQRCVAAKARAG